MKKTLDMNSKVVHKGHMKKIEPGRNSVRVNMTLDPYEWEAFRIKCHEKWGLSASAAMRMFIKGMIDENSAGILIEKPDFNEKTR